MMMPMVTARYSAMIPREIRMLSHSYQSGDASHGDCRYNKSHAALRGTISRCRALNWSQHEVRGTTHDERKKYELYIAREIRT